MMWVIEALLLLAFVTLVGLAADVPREAPDGGCSSVSAELAVSIAEMPDAVRLRIQASGEVEAGSIEVRFAGRKMVVLARDAAGRAIRSESLRLPEAVVEDGASAGYDADGALVITLRKQATASPPIGEPEAAVR
jgi:hypothetical protein